MEIEKNCKMCLPAILPVGTPSTRFDIVLYVRREKVGAEESRVQRERERERSGPIQLNYQWKISQKKKSEKKKRKKVP